MVYSADAERAELVAFALGVGTEYRACAVADVTALRHELAVGGVDCVVVLRSASETDEMRAAIAALWLHSGAAQVPVIEVLYACRPLLAAGVTLPGPLVMFALREALRIACIRKRGPKVDADVSPHVRKVEMGKLWRERQRERRVA